MRKRPNVSAGALGTALLLGIGKMVEEALFNLPIPTVIWLSIFIACLLIAIVLFPFKSFRNPKEMLKFTIKWVDYSEAFEIEPAIRVFLKVQNESDIEQTVNSLKGEVFYSASYIDNTFPNHPLQNPIIESKFVVKNKASKLLSIRTPILPISAERFKKYMEVGEYIFWSGIIQADISAKIWWLERGGRIENMPLAKFPHVPTSQRFEGMEE